MSDILYEGSLPKLTGTFRLHRQGERFFYADHKADWLGAEWMQVDRNAEFNLLSDYIYSELYKHSLEKLYKLARLKAFI